MATTHEHLTPPVRAWIERQQMFFVSTAPLAAEGHVNVSPKGLDSLRILGEHRVAYLDMTGSGAETIAHVRENGRISLMFCAFDGPPRIVRLQGRGTVALPGTPHWDGLIGEFPQSRGQRAIIEIECDRVSDSCGYSVPLYDYVGQRGKLAEWADHKTDDELVAYRRAKNAVSIDGLPAYPSLEMGGPQPA